MDLAEFEASSGSEGALEAAKDVFCTEDAEGRQDIGAEPRYGSQFLPCPARICALLAFNCLIVTGFRAVKPFYHRKKQAVMYQKGPFQ